MVPITSTSSNGVDNIEAMMQTLMKSMDKRLQDQEKRMEENGAIMQKMSNELVTMKRQQAQSNKPPQPHY